MVMQDMPSPLPLGKGSGEALAAQITTLSPSPMNKKERDVFRKL